MEIGGYQGAEEEMIFTSWLGNLREVIRPRQTAAARAIRITRLMLLFGVVLRVACGLAWASEEGASKSGTASFRVFPNQVFTTGKPGQLGLYIEGEDWHLLIDMPGYARVSEVGKPPEFFMPEHFLFMRHPASGTTASLLAEKVPGADGERACREWHAPYTSKARDQTARHVGNRGTVGKVVEVERHGKRLQVFDSEDRQFGPRKAIFWFPWYRGHCFDIHFNVTSPVAEEEALKIFDSLTYVPGKPVGVEISRGFGFAGRTLMRLSVPIAWQYRYRPGPPGPVGGAELLPSSTPIASFLVFPLGTRSPGVRERSLHDEVEVNRRSIERRMQFVSPVRQVCSTGTCVYFFDLSVGPFLSSDPHSYEYHRQGWADFDGRIMGLSLLYRDDSKEDAQRMTEAFSRAQVADLAVSSPRPAATCSNPAALSAGKKLVFTTGQQGQLGLHLEGEDWHLLVDMPGFEPDDSGAADCTDVFLGMSNQSTGIKVSVAAERVDGPTDAESCRRHYATRLQQTRDAIARDTPESGIVGPVVDVEMNGKIVQLVKARPPKSQVGGPDVEVKLLNWFPYYRGFCFTFFLVFQAAEAEKEVQRFLDSVTYVNHPPPR